MKNDSGKRQGVDVHRLVASAWLGPIPKGMWVNHENGDKTDNRVENLRIDTPSYNHRHAFNVLGRSPGIKANVDRQEAIEVLLAAGWSKAKIAKALQVTTAAISKRS